MSRDAVIVGAAETRQLGRVNDQSSLQMHLESARAALAEAGLSIHDVDGIATATPRATSPRARWLDQERSSAAQ